MPSFKTTRRVAHSAQRMFDLVADIEQYPEFLPLCTGLRVLRRLKSPEGNDVFVAEMSVGYKAIAERFTTKVTLDRPACRIDVEYVDGPFKYLRNIWNFRPDGSSCLVEFDISYEFRSLALRLLMGAMFERAFAHFASAFEKRADAIYGRAGGPAA